MNDELYIKVMVAAPSSGESLDESNASKERVLGSMFGRLSVVESRGMWLRLSRLREGDALSEAFARFPEKMRSRMLTFLVDERRLKSVAAQAAR